MVKMKRPSCSQHGLFEATCCLMCPYWSPFKNRTKINLVWSGFWGLIDTVDMLYYCYFETQPTFYLQEICLPRSQNNWIKPVEAALHKSWRVFEFFILTAVMGAFFFVKAWIIFELLNSHCGWEINFWAVSLLGVVLSPRAYFWNFYSISGTLSSKTLFVQYVKKKKKRLTLTETWEGSYSLLKNKLHDLRHLQTSVQRFILSEESGQSGSS